MRNAGNMSDGRMYQYRRTTPGVIKGYVAEVVRQLDYIADYEGPQLSLADKIEFLNETRHAFGRSALVLR